MKLLINKWTLLITILLLWTGAGILLFGKSSGQESAATSINGTPERIICCAPNLAEIAFALGIGDKLVGVPDSSKHPAAVKDIPKIGSFWTPAIEPIIAKRPDLTITLGFSQQKSLAAGLNSLGHNTLTVNIETIDEFYDAVKAIGAATNTQQQADTLIGDLKHNIDEYSKRMHCDTPPKVLWVVQRQPLRVAGSATFVNDMIELAGGVNAIGNTDYQYPPIGSEQVYALKPDIIIEPAMTTDDLDMQLKSAKQYWNKFDIPATINQRIYVIDADAVSQLGPRLFEGIQTISKCVRPELFEETIQ